MIEVKIIPNKNRGAAFDTSAYSFAATENVRNLHTSLAAYNVTPLIELKNFSAAKKIRALFVKDESTRFNLKAFKALGGVWAIYKVITRELALDNPTLDEIFQHRAELDKMTFITTTDGNHGKGVSWAAGLFGCKAFIYMPRGTVEVRAQAIRDAYIEASNAHALRMDAATNSKSLQRCAATTGSNVTFVRDASTATVEITDRSYDDCVKFTKTRRRKPPHLCVGRKAALPFFFFSVKYDISLKNFIGQTVRVYIPLRHPIVGNLNATSRNICRAVVNQPNAADENLAASP